MDELMMQFYKLKKLEPVVLAVLEEDETTRKNDFILYAGVLKKLGLNLNMSVDTFLYLAKGWLKAPPFESVTRCRRKIQKFRPDLQDLKTALAREESEEVYKEYNRAEIGGN